MKSHLFLHKYRLEPVKLPVQQGFFPVALVTFLLLFCISQICAAQVSLPQLGN